MSTPEPQRTEWTGGACALVVIGLLILVPSGLCTGSLGIMAIAEALFPSKFGIVSGGGTLNDLFPVLIIGGPFIIGGIFLIRLGLRSRKSK
jgi:hypothetical protein